MIEAEWWDYDTPAEMADAVASDVQFIIESALDARGSALLALPGGTTPGPVYAKLAKAKLDWKRVTILPTDERLVAMTDKLSNAGALAKVFLPLGARVVPLATGPGDPRQAGLDADERLGAMSWPLDLVLLGVGEDGHAASIFNGPDLAAALAAPARAIGVRPEPLPAAAPVARVTLTAATIRAARTLTIILSGDAKRKMLESAIDKGAASPYPVGPLLAAADQAVDIHWSAK